MLACAGIASTASVLQQWLMPVWEMAGQIGTVLSALFLLPVPETRKRTPEPAEEHALLAPEHPASPVLPP